MLYIIGYLVILLLLKMLGLSVLFNIVLWGGIGVFALLAIIIVVGVVKLVKEDKDDVHH